MNPIVKLLLAQLLLFFYACSVSETDIQTYSEDDFKTIIKLSEERKMTKTILSIRDFFIKDSLLFVCNSRNDSIFMIFNVNTMECINSWGIKGRGPGEYGLFTDLIDLPRKEFYIADFSSFKIQTFTIPEFRMVEEKKINNNRYDKVMAEIPQTILTTDGSLFFYDKYMMHELKLTRWENGNTPVEIYHFEKLKEKYNSKASQIFGGCLEINRILKRIVYAYRYFRRFDIMDFEGNVIKEVEITPTVPPPVFKDDGNPDLGNSVRCFSAVRATDNSIYLYYVGHSFNNSKKEGFLADSYIEEYNWDGRPLKRFKLNRIIGNFDILSDKDGSKVFIGVDERNEHPLMFFTEVNEE